MGGIQIETEKEGWGGDTNRDRERGVGGGTNRYAEGGRGVEIDTISNLVFYAQIETGGGGGG